MTVEEVIHNLESRGVMPKRVPTLERMYQALARFDFKYPTDLRRVIVIAGTNGKGSTGRTLETLLRGAVQKTGLYTSPHIINTRERIRIQGHEINEDDFVRTFHAVESSVRDLELSHFEMLTVMAAHAFFSGDVEPVVDYAIFEVGLGGTWDATNAIPHKTCVICTLGFDHVEYLGSSLGEIAKNKFGIVTSNADVYHLPLTSSLDGLQKQVQKQTSSRWWPAPAFSWRVDVADRFPRWFLKSKWGGTELALQGQRGAENSNLALHVFASLGFDPKPHLSQLASVLWPARMQRIHIEANGQNIRQNGIQNPLQNIACPVFVSGDHNVQGVESLKLLLKSYRYNTLHLLIGIGTKKDLDPIMELFVSFPRAKLWLTTASFQGRTEEEFGSWKERAVGYFPQPMDALRAISHVAHENDLCVITGSLYLAGDILRDLQISPDLQATMPMFTHCDIAET